MVYQIHIQTVFLISDRLTSLKSKLDKTKMDGKEVTMDVDDSQALVDGAQEIFDNITVTFNGLSKKQ